MTTVQFNIFSDFRNDFRTYCKKLSEEFSSILIPLQKNAAQKDTPDYPLENPVVYNTALDEITEQRGEIQTGKDQSFLVDNSQSVFL